MFDLIKRFIDHFLIYKQPFHFYLDYRFSSIELLIAMHRYNYFVLMACNKNTWPKPLFEWLARDLPIRDWRYVSHRPTNSIVFARCIKGIKKKKCQYLITNFASLKEVKINYTRSGSVKKTTSIWSPKIQSIYNKRSCYVDVVNKLLLLYWRRPRYLNSNHAYFYFFINAFLHQSYVLWKNTRLNKNSNTNKLSYVLLLLQTLKKKFGPSIEVKEMPHVAISLDDLPQSKRKRCYNQHCNLKTRQVCYGCRQWLCPSHMKQKHMKLIKNKEVNF